MSDVEEVLSRIPDVSDWTEHLNKVVAMLQLGILMNWEVIALGLEDLNIKVDTSKGSYLYKGFASSRSVGDLQRYEEVLSIIDQNDVSHPKLIKSDGKIVHEQDSVKYCMYEWASGKSFYQLGRTPDDKEFRKIIEIAAKINKTSEKPKFLDDPWAVYNLPDFFKSYKDDLDPEDSVLIEQAVAEYEKINHNVLPHAFVHGDITQQNLILSDNGEIYLIDFAVANYYPRIQELALIVSLLMNKSESIESRMERALKEYGKYIEMTDVEKDALFAYVTASQAMEILGVYRERAAGGNLEELDYWINIGREGLKKSFRGTITK